VIHDTAHGTDVSLEQLKLNPCDFAVITLSNTKETSRIFFITN
jgi:hypothetical protein